MEIETAREIARLANLRLIDGIKLLREHTPMSLLEARTYIDSAATREDLVRKLREDFVKDKKTLLREAMREQARLKAYIERLEGEIEIEEMENPPEPKPPRKTIGTLQIFAGRHSVFSDAVAGKLVGQEGKGWKVISAKRIELDTIDVEVEFDNTITPQQIRNHFYERISITGTPVGD